METRHTDADLAAKPAKKRKPVQLIRLEYTAKNVPPLELDFAGSTYTFPAIGSRYEQKLMPKTSQIHGLETDANGNVKKVTVRHRVLTWCEVPKSKPLLEGENAVEVPVEAWRAWQARQSERKKFTSATGEQLLIPTAQKLEAMSLDFSAARAELARIKEEIEEKRALNAALKPGS